MRAQRGRVSELEAGHCALRETVIVYRRRISILDKQLKLLSHYPLQGFNDIIRINLQDFLRRMDSPHVPVYMNEGKGEFHTQAAERGLLCPFRHALSLSGQDRLSQVSDHTDPKGDQGFDGW